VAGIYSTQFCLGATAVALKYTVPAGKLAVIKCVTGVNTYTSPLAATVDISGTYIWIGSIPGAGALTAGGLMIVAKAGQIITAAGEARIHLSVSGYLLNTLPGG